MTDADGRTIDYAYNAVGEQTSETWVGGNYTATYQYNAAGELTSASDPYSTYTYTYDADGRETSVSNAGTPAVPTVTLSYSYDAYGNLTNLTDSVGGMSQYYYNGASQLTSLWAETGGGLMPTVSAEMSFSYDSDGLLTGMTRATGMGGDTISTSYSYDNANQLTNITDTDTTKSVTLASYTYGYNAGGELTSYQDNSNNSLTYSYDSNGELTGATGTLNGSNYSVSYSYDLNGNRTMSGYQTGTGNELLSDGTYDYMYDKDGNMTSQTNIATGNVTYYTWDYENRLTEEKVENSQGQVLSDETFTYDVNNNRIAVSLNGMATLYTVYDGSNLYLDFNGSGQLTERYLTNPKGLSQFYGQVNGSGTTQWFLTDNINSIRQVISSSGSSLDAITYDPYGNILSQTNAVNAPRLMYAGAAVDSLTGNYLDTERYYGPMDGRFLSQDWLGLRPDNDPYRYVGNQPTDEIDSFGTFSIKNILYFTPVGGALIAYDMYNSYQGYVNAGVPTPSALVAAYGSNMPIFGSIFSGYEMIDGVSLRAPDLGRPLNGWDYTGRTVNIGLDLLFLYGIARLAYPGRVAISAPKGVSSAQAVEQGLVRPGGTLNNVLQGIEQELGGAPPTSQAQALQAISNATDKLGLRPGFSAGALPGTGGDVVLLNAGGVITTVKPTGQIVITNAEGQTILNILSGG